VVEAMSVGVPLVVTDVPALHEAMGSAECGSIVPVADPGRLGDAVLDVLDDPGVGQRRATAARARFDQLYRLDRVVDQIVAFYQRALGDSRS
jgi:glycosyltransferase involved in cell wall biosynthesis